MRRTTLVLLVSAILGAPLAGGLISHAAPGGGAGGQGPSLFHEPSPAKTNAQRQNEPEQGGAAGVDGGALDAGTISTGRPPRW